jgi:hypothetical protein
MTHDPFQRFAIVPVITSRPPDEAIVVGPLSEMMSFLPDTFARNDAISRLDEGLARAARIDQLQSMTRVCNVLAFADSITRLTRRMDDLEAKRADNARRAEEQAAREAEEREEREAQEIQDALNSLPGGELHELAPPSTSEDPDPDLELEGDDAGGVPLSYKQIPTSYVRGGPRDTTGDLPKELSDPPDPVPEPRGSTLPPPTAISFHED